MAVKICEHIKASGIGCGSPTPKGERLCYFHKGLGQALPSSSGIFFSLEGFHYGRQNL